MVLSSYIFHLSWQVNKFNQKRAWHLSDVARQSLLYSAAEKQVAKLTDLRVANHNSRGRAEINSANEING